MLKILEGFTIDVKKTSVSYDKIFFTKGQIQDLITDIVYVRNGFSINKADGVLELYYDPIIDEVVLKLSRDDNSREVYIGNLSQTQGVISLAGNINNTQSVGSILSSTQGVVHTESIVVANGLIITQYAPNVIIEIYVEGYGFMDVSSSFTKLGNKIDLHSQDLNGMTIRIVYES